MDPRVHSWDEMAVLCGEVLGVAPNPALAQKFRSANVKRTMVFGNRMCGVLSRTPA